VVEPGEKRVSGEEESAFELVAVPGCGPDSAFLLELDSESASPLFSLSECFGEGFGACRVDADAGGPFNGGKNAVEGIEEDLLPGGEAEPGEFEFLGVEGALTDVVFGSLDVHPGGVIDGSGRTGNDIVAGEFYGSFFDSVDIVPVKDEGLFGEICESGWVFEEHIAPHCGSTPYFDDSLDERGEVIVVEPGFFVFALASHSGGAFGAFPELGSFIAADMDDFGFEDFDCFVDEVLAESDEFGATGAGLETGVGFFAEMAAFLDIEEPFKVTQKVDEGDDLEGGEFALETLDLVGGDRAFTVAPGG